MPRTAAFLLRGSALGAPYRIYALVRLSTVFNRFPALIGLVT